MANKFKIFSNSNNIISKYQYRKSK